MAGSSPDGRKYAFDAGVAERQLQQTGGFSMQRTTGRAPARRGYMVSDFGSEHVVHGYASAREIAEYHQANPNPSGRTKKYVGGWHDEGKTYLDQSRRVMSPRTAQAVGQQNAQRAVYSLKSGEARRVHFGGPVDVRGSLFEGHKEPTQQLRVGNSDAHRQQAEMELHLQAASAHPMGAGRSRAHSNGYQPQLPGMRAY